MAKENPTLNLYRASRERVRKTNADALAKAVAAVSKKGKKQEAANQPPPPPPADTLPPEGGSAGAPPAEGAPAEQPATDEDSPA